MYQGELMLQTKEGLNILVLITHSAEIFFCIVISFFKTSFSFSHLLRDSQLRDHYQITGKINAE